MMTRARLQRTTYARCQTWNSPKAEMMTHRWLNFRNWLLELAVAYTLYVTIWDSGQACFIL